jgi:hypothetical protein
MWSYEQSTGWLRTPEGAKIAQGYAGSELGKNNPECESVKDYGPLPCGGYTMQEPVDTKTHGPFVIWLTPDEGNQMFGRAGFGIHGDSVVNPGTASEGCICLPKWAREMCWRSEDHRLQVVKVYGEQAKAEGA